MFVPYALPRIPMISINMPYNSFCTFAIFCVICNNHKQNIRTITTSVRTNFGKSITSHIERYKWLAYALENYDLFVYVLEGKTKNIV